MTNQQGKTLQRTMHRILIVTDVRVHGEQLGTACTTLGGEFIGTINGADCAALRDQERRPSLLLVDASTVKPDQLGHLASSPSLRIPFVVYGLDIGSPHLMLRFAQLGAAGIATRECDLDELRRTVLTALTGSREPLRSVLSRLVHTEATSANGRPRSGNLKCLTPRELEVAALYAAPAAIKAVAQHLGVTEGTVEQHLDHIYKKLRIHRKSELVEILNAR